ncbi:MAG: hypothetical protein AABW64_03025 [Nanoarchaeota archaeon]
MHKRLLITALILIFIAFLAAQISQQQHTLVTGNLVAGEKTQEDLFLPQQEQQPPTQKNMALQQQQKPRKETAFRNLVAWYDYLTKG